MITIGHPVNNPLQNEQARETQRTGQMDSKNQVTAAKPEEQTTSTAKRLDEFVHTEAQDSTDSPGLYSLSKDENGDLKISFDSAKKQEAPSVNQAKDEKPAEEKPEITKCTVNNDKVEAEIKKLREDRQKIQQQLQQAASDPKKKAALQSQLAGIDAQLQAKDNDAYKKQNSALSFSNVR